jgi:RNA polymerase sigma-70 factor (ECF subfamily)
MADSELPDALRDELRGAWHRYLDLVAPLRPALHGYCRRLAGNLWDAEDLVQDTLLRGFGRLASIHHEVANPRAYLLRTATHLWIDALRRRESERAALGEPPASEAGGAPAGEARDAGAALLQRLSPQERAAVLLKDGFDLSLEEIADVLVTTPGAVKAALHRGRDRLRDLDDAPASTRTVPSVELVDRFVAALRAGDVGGLTRLMLDGGSLENVGCSVEFGRHAFERKDGWIHKAVHGHPEWPAALQPEAVRVERGVFEGEPVVLAFATRRGREALEQVLRLDEHDGRVARMRAYAFCPETMREVGAALGLRVRTGLYRYPTPAPGQRWPEPGASGAALR